MEVGKRLTPSQYFGSAKFLDANPDVEKRFARAMDKSLDYAQANEAEVRKVIPTYSAIPKPVAAKVPLPYWTSELNVASVRQQGELAKKYKALKEEPDTDAILPKGGESSIDLERIVAIDVHTHAEVVGGRARPDAARAAGGVGEVLPRRGRHADGARRGRPLPRAADGRGGVHRGLRDPVGHPAGVQRRGHRGVPPSTTTC